MSQSYIRTKESETNFVVMQSVGCVHDCMKVGGGGG